MTHSMMARHCLMAVSLAALVLVGIATAVDVEVDIMMESPTRSAAAASLDLPYTDVTRGLSAWYCFQGNATDCTGKSPAGVPHSAAGGADGGPRLVADRFGREKSAYAFSRAKGEYFTIPASVSSSSSSSPSQANLSLVLPSLTFTWSAWVRLDLDHDKRFGILARNHPTAAWTLAGKTHAQKVNHERLSGDNENRTCTADAVRYSKERQDENVTISGKVGETDAYSQAKASTPTGKWQHLAVTSDGCAQHYFLNGELTDITQTQVQWPKDDQLGQWAIGSMGCGAHCANFDGALDDVRLYDRALSVKEVQSVWGACEGICQNADMVVSLLRPHSHSPPHTRTSAHALRSLALTRSSDVRSVAAGASYRHHQLIRRECTDLGSEDRHQSRVRRQAIRGRRNSGNIGSGAPGSDPVISRIEEEEEEKA